MKKNNSLYKHRLFLFFLSSLPFCALGQHEDLVDSSQVHVLLDTTKKYAIPDIVNRRSMRWASGGNKLFTYQLGLVPILDYTVFVQDEDSKKQVGKQENQGDIRSARISLRGRINFKKPWSYFFSVGYNGLDYDPSKQAPWNITDLYFVIPAGAIGNLTIGKIKETFTYEMVGDAGNLPQAERILNPFFNSRNIGLRLNKTLLNDRMTVAAGMYNDWFTQGESFSESANTFTARVTGLPLYEENGKRYLHLAASTRYVQEENGVLRYKGKNESNVSTNYVDTKEFEASGAWNIGFEQLWNINNFSLLGEYVHSWANTPTGTEQFGGYYFTASWVISGEQRPYDKKVAYARRIKPTGKAGAWEIVSRVSQVDLDGKEIEGGILNKMYLGLNWWATQHWRISFGYGVSNLHKTDIVGITNSFLFRLQWIY